MELCNEIASFKPTDNNDIAARHEAIVALLTLLSLYAPHVGEYLLEALKIDARTQAFPVLDKSALINDTITMVVQVNGKVRGKMEVASGTDQAELIREAKNIESVSKYLIGDIKKRLSYPINSSALLWRVLDANKIYDSSRCNGINFTIIDRLRIWSTRY